MSKPLYANTISVVTSNSKEEVVIAFSHKYPHFDFDAQTSEQREELVASILIGRELAENLPSIIEGLFKEDEKLHA